jgi:16S rRNA processing protein RimM
VTPELLRVHGDGLVVKLSEVIDRNGSEALRGYWIGAPRETLPETASDEFYWADLIGLSVLNTEGDMLGQVDRLIETGANAVLIVKDCSVEKPHERLIPFVGDIVRNVDKSTGQILVNWSADW